MSAYVQNKPSTAKYVLLLKYSFKPAVYELPQTFETVSDKLRYYRIKSGLLQAYMAKLLKIDRGTYIRYESGATKNYPPDVIMNFANIFGIEADKLLDEYNLFIFKGQSKQVRNKRLESGLTQGEFGKLYGVSKNTVRRWENGSVKISKKLWKRIFKKGIG